MAATTEAAGRAGDVPSLLQRVVDEAATVLGADFAAIYLVAADGSIARCACASGSDAAEGRRAVGGAAIPAVEGMVGQALASGETLTTQDLAADRRFLGREQLDRASSALGLRAGVASPMVGSGHVALGVLCLFGRATPEFTEHDVVLIRSLAAQAALAIESGRLAERLRDAETRHRFLLDRLPDCIWAAGADRVFTYVSAGSERILGYRPDELIGRSSTIVMHESSREAFEAGYRWQIAHPDGDQTYRVNLRHKDGHPVPVELHNIGTPVDGEYAGGTGSLREMAERDRLEREIRAQAAELAASRERAHLAQELHDSVTQALFSMTITAGAARMLLERHAPGVGAKLDELSALSRDALAEMRSLIFELRPGSLAEEGFRPALQKHVAAVQGRTGLIIRLDVAPDLPRLSPSAEDALYRIAQEALHNVVKHARAHEVGIWIGNTTAGARMEIRDDGAGFDPRARSDGLGLVGMMARAERLGGRFTVESGTGCGTIVSVTIPFTVGDTQDRDRPR